MFTRQRVVLLTTSLLVCYTVSTSAFFKPPPSKTGYGGFNEYEDPEEEELWERNRPEKLKKKKLNTLRPGDPFDPKKGLDPQVMNRLAQEKNQGQTMAFVKLRKDKTGERHEKIVDGLARMWGKGLSQAHLQAKLFSVDKDTMIIVVDNVFEHDQVADFVLRQPEAFAYEYGSKTYKAKGVTDDDDPKPKEQSKTDL